MCLRQCYGVKRVKVGRRGRKSCASSSASTGGVQLAWRVFVAGKQTEIWSGWWGGEVIKLKFFMSWTR